MACESCRLQARMLANRLGPRATGLSPSLSTRSRSHVLRSFKAEPIAIHNRCFSQSSRRNLLGIGGSLVETYRVVGASEKLFKVCGKPANYQITAELRKNDQVEKMEDGEEIGASIEKDNVWHNYFQLKPTFSTWSHVTMLHLYLLNARIRCFDRDMYRNWQQQLIDHFFFECEKKMHVDHSISSSALRQRYLKDVFVQWRGLLLAYDEGLIKGDAVLASAIWRNLFKGDPETDPRFLVAIVGWMRSSLAELEGTSDEMVQMRAADVLQKPVNVFWQRLEKPFSEGGKPQAEVTKAQVEPQPTPAA